MRKNILLTAIILAPLALLFSGCITLQHIHHDAQVSVDIATGHFKGNSTFETHQKPGVNVGYLMSEPFAIAVSGNSGSGSQFDQADPYALQPAGGPSDGAKQAAVNWRTVHPPVAPPPAGYFTLSEGLELVGKGFKTTDQAGTESDALYYLELPVLVNYNMKVNGDHELRFGLGPYAAAALFGHYSGNFGGMHTSGSLKFGPTADYNRMDYGLVLNAGYMICPKVSLSLNYDLGLRNIYSPEDKIFNRSVGLSLGYRIK